MASFNREGRVCKCYLPFLKWLFQSSDIALANGTAQIRNINPATMYACQSAPLKNFIIASMAPPPGFTFLLFSARLWYLLPNSIIFQFPGAGYRLVANFLRLWQFAWLQLIFLFLWEFFLALKRLPN